jgi:hypothetical protein
MVEKSGDNSSNTLDGTDDKDTLKGLGGNDTLNGLGGDDKLYGGDGNDKLTGGNGNDWLDGGTGDDVYYFDANDGTDRIASLDDGDKLIFYGEGSLVVDVIDGHGTVTFAGTRINVDHATTINAYAEGGASATATGGTSVESGDIEAIDTLNDIGTFDIF